MGQAIDVSEAVAPVKKSSRSWQFSMRGLMILMTLCCAVIAMMACPPLFVIAGILSLVALSIFCVVAMIYGRGWIRPFSILCSITLFVFFFAMFNVRLHGPESAGLFFLIQFAGSVFVGLSGSAAHGLLKKRSGLVPIPNVPLLRSWLHNPDPK